MTKRPLPDPLFAAGTKLLIVTLASAEPKQLTLYAKSSLSDGIVCDISAGLLHGADVTVTSDRNALFPLIVRPFGGPATLYASAAESDVSMHEAKDGAPVLVMRDFTSPMLRGNIAFVTVDSSGLYDAIAQNLRLRGATSIYPQLQAIDNRMRTLIGNLLPAILTR